MAPSRHEQDELHSAVLAGDPTAPPRVFELLLDLLIVRLRFKWLDGCESEGSIKSSIGTAYRRSRKSRRTKSADLRRFFRALFRTRTGDPLLTMEVSGRYWRARPGTRDHVVPANSRFAPCRSCPRVPARALADVPVSYPRAVVYFLNRSHHAAPTRPQRMRRAALGVQPHHERRGWSRLSRRGRLHRGRAR
jgi:hypothetical protein